HAKLFAILVPIVLLMVISTLMFRAIFDRDNVISGGDATGFMGGTALILLVLSTFGHEGSKGLEKIIDHLREGCYFAIKIFAPVIPIAGFFFYAIPASDEDCSDPGRLASVCKGAQSMPPGYETGLLLRSCLSDCVGLWE